jgi:transposase-like protein
MFRSSNRIVVFLGPDNRMYATEDEMEASSSEESPKDTLGRRVTPRRFRSMEERRRIVEETLVPGESVAGVARRNAVNANQVFVWRKQYQQGLLQTDEGGQSTPDDLGNSPAAVGTLKRYFRRPRSATDSPALESEGDFIELELAGGDRIRVHGKAATQLLERIIETLVRR